MPMLLSANKGHGFIDSTYDFVPFVALLSYCIKFVLMWQ